MTDEEVRAKANQPFRDAAFSDQTDPEAYDRLVAPLLERVPAKAKGYAAEIARREGRNPEELGLVEMSSEAPTAVGAEAKPDPYFEKAYDMVRKGREGKNTNGPSLLEFISKRGGLNEPGELSRMDAQTWHKAKPFMRKLIQEDGDSADGMAMRAWEAGYFPQFYERPTPNDLFNAIRQELSGKKIYSRVDTPSAEQKAYTDALERRLSDAGIDPTAVKPRDAWKRLFDFDAETNSLQDLAEEGTVSRPPVVDVGYERRPTLETLHYMKKGLDQELDDLKDPVTGQLNLEGNPLASATVGIRSDFGKALRQLNENYDIFMQRWGDDSDHLDALRLGRAILKPSVKSELLGRRVADMSRTQREFFRKGVGEALLDAARSKGGIPAMRQLVRSEEVGSKVRQAFGSQQAFDDFMEAATQRVRAQDRNNTILGNSRTFNRAAAAEDLRNQPEDPLDTLGDVFSLHPGTAAAKVAKKVLKGVPRKDRSVLGDPQLNRRLAEIMADPEKAADALEALIEQEVARRTGVPAIAANTAARYLGEQSGNEGGRLTRPIPKDRTKRVPAPPRK